MTRRIAICILLTFPTLSIADDSEGLEFFETKIRPVLVKHCYECHAADSKAVKGGLLVDSAAGLLQGGDSGPALVADKPDESVLIEALKYESYEMPPEGKLSEEVIADFEKWVAMGAPDPRTETSGAPVLPREINIEEGRKFWAFQSPESHVVPEVNDTEWPRNWIDNFVLDRLEENDLTPIEDADRATLIRRIAYDLTGLPPQPADVEEIIYNDDPHAVTNYVDGLLESQQYAEHWARHWLDVARYADSNGGDFNATFHNAWRYRNYVIETFRDDRPYHEFVKEQLAGDLIESSDDLQRERNLVATGFLMFGTKMLSERDKEKLRMDVVDEQINSIGKAFMGMTLGCARCHDHKFDPIPTEDYYALAGILRSTQTLDGEIQKYVSNWTRQPLPISEDHAASIKEHAEATASLAKDLKSAEKKLKELESNSSRDSILNQGILIDDEEAELVGNWKASTYSKNFIGKGYIHDDKKDLGQKKVIFRTEVPVDGEYEVRLAFPGSGGRASNVPVTIENGGEVYEVIVDQTKSAPILSMLKPIGQFTFQKSQRVVVTISNTKTNGYVIVDALQVISVAELKNQKDSADKEIFAQIDGQKKVIAEIKAKQKTLDKNAPPPAPLALAVREAKDQGDYSVCIRGEPRNLGARVPRGFLTVASFDHSPEIANDQSGRLELANWIADPQHPLTARVYVNRIWHHLMGHGIVRSVDNFGLLGERPTHPELLDQLAVEFIQHDWSTKWLVREIVNSRTYQLSSRHDEERWQQDAENRLLWRMNRKPLSAEAIRDSMLLAAGELDFSMGGPPVDNLGTLVTQNKPDDAGIKLESTNIRTMYQPVIRNELPALMRVFDFADPDFVSGRRAQTTVPTQALWMLNGPMIAEKSKKVVNELFEKEFSTDAERLEFLYLTTTGRPPTEEEIDIAFEFLNSIENNQEAKWTDLTHAILASSTFRMLD